MGVSQAGWEGAWACVRECVCVRVERRQGWSAVLFLEVCLVCLAGPLQPSALVGVSLRWCAASSVSVHVVGADPRRGKSPCGESAEDSLQLSSPLVLSEEIVAGDRDGDHPLGAWRVRVPGRLVEGEEERRPWAQQNQEKFTSYLAQLRRMCFSLRLWFFKKVTELVSTHAIVNTIQKKCKSLKLEFNGFHMTERDCALVRSYLLQTIADWGPTVMFGRNLEMWGMKRMKSTSATSVWIWRRPPGSQRCSRI